MLRTHVAGQALIGVACALFLGGTVGLFVGVVDSGMVGPLGAVALACLAAGATLARP